MYLDSSNIKNLETYETLKDIAHCAICTGIIFEPQQCVSCENCFCKNCLNDWLSKSKSCPMKCSLINFKDSRIVRTMLTKLKFICPYGCSEEVLYENILNHREKCEKVNIDCPCCGSKVARSNIKISDSVTSNAKIESLMREIEILKSRNIELETSFRLIFPNRSRIFKTSGGNSLRTFTYGTALPENYKISIKFTKLVYQGHMVIGFTDKIINSDRGYLGGDMGPGNWGIAGNGSIGEEGRWIRGVGFSQGDVIKLYKNGSVITYSINNNPQKYSYDLKKKNLYFAVSYYYTDEVIELLD